MAEEVSVGVDFDLEPRLPEPRRCKAVRLVLRGRSIRPIRSWTTADRVELVEPVEDPHGRSVEAERVAAVAKRTPSGIFARAESVFADSALAQ